MLQFTCRHTAIGRCHGDCAVTSFMPPIRPFDRINARCSLAPQMAHDQLLPFETASVIRADDSELDTSKFVLEMAVSK